MHRYFVFIWDKGDSESVGRIASLQHSLLSSPPWEGAYVASGVLVIHEPPNQRSASVHPLAGDQGVILGTVFHRMVDGLSKPHDGAFTESETSLILGSAGRHLVRSYWGTYIAVMRDRNSGTCSLLRDPTANLACYYAKCGDTHVFFSDMGAFRHYVPMRLSINWKNVATRLLAGVTLSRDCSINEIEDIPGGECVTISQGVDRRAAAWHPAEFCGENGLQDERTAAAQLRSTVLGTVAALASQHDRILVLLSGGLDSSILACALARQATHLAVTCLNFYVSTDVATESADLMIPGVSAENLAKLRRVVGSADEREFARKVAQICGFRLIETERPIFDIDFTRLYNAPLAPRPSGYGFIIDEDDAEYQCASESQATACFSGQGGDSVFYATQLAIGALDYSFLHPLGTRLIHEIASTATLSRESAAHIFAKVVKHGFLRARLPEPFEPLKRPHLLRNEIADTVPPNYFDHPWVDGISHLCPGKHYHVLGVATCVPLYHHIFNRERIAPSIHPFASQPVVETCLRIPTYVLLMNGISRGLARHTFSDLLPPEVAKRTVKGSGMAYTRAVVTRNMRLIREHLLDGVLAREKVLDRGKLEMYLTDEQPFLSVKPEQIMDYLACEAWVTQLTPTT